MSYCATATIITIVPGLPQETATNGWTETVAVISQHITRADGIIDGYLARRYAVPFTSTAVPPAIRTIAEDITSYYTFRSFYSQDNHNRTEYFDELIMHARHDLELIRDGKMDLVLTSGSDAPLKSTTTQSPLDSTTRSYQSHFDIDDSLYWDFDSDLKDSVSDSR